MRPKTLAAALIGAAVFVTSARAEAPTLAFPVDCALGETCFLQQFVDHDPGPGARAYDCGPQSYDGHTGTDIRVADLEAMAEGVTVLAAADGTVRAIRDGVADGGTAAMPDGQGCGNGVAITHPGGWETQYCHLMQGSLRVAEGDIVTTGTPLGLIGFSGRTEFPHLEFLVRDSYGGVVDPFYRIGRDDNTCSYTVPDRTLWADPVPNPGGGLMEVGFAAGVPEFEAIRAGTADADSLQVNAPGLVLWGFVHGARAGDAMELRITGPDGSPIHENRVDLERTQAQLFRASGRRTPDEGWPVGRYHGEVTLIRDGVVLSARRAEIDLR